MTEAIDFRSDTITKPTPEMRNAMLEAEVGDDVYDEDPTVNSLQERCAKLFNKEAALFVSSGTQGNLLALLSHCARGDQAIVGESSHIQLWEQSGASSLGSISLKTIPNELDGTMDLTQIEKAINPDNVHRAITRLICIENTWNGQPLTKAYVDSVGALAKKHGLRMHVDGARIFNASVALKLPVSDLVAPADSVQLCFSKGLSAPAGSMICGSKEFIHLAKRYRKAVGGGMRQVGVLAAPCHVSLDKMIDRLADDHRNAKRFAEGLATLDGIRVEVKNTKTNMVFFDTTLPVSRSEFVKALGSAGVKVGIEDRLGIRAVTHKDIKADDIEEAIDRVAKALSQLA